MAMETWVQSQVESYQRLKKCYLMPPYLAPSILRYGSRVKWSNPGKVVAPSHTPWCSSYRKGSLRVTLHQRETTSILSRFRKISYSFNSLRWLIVNDYFFNCSYIIKIICTQLYGFKYSYVILIFFSKYTTNMCYHSRWEFSQNYIWTLCSIRMWY